MGWAIVIQSFFMIALAYNLLMKDKLRVSLVAVQVLQSGGTAMSQGCQQDNYYSHNSLAPTSTLYQVWLVV